MEADQRDVLDWLIEAIMDGLKVSRQSAACIAASAAITANAFKQPGDWDKDVFREMVYDVLTEAFAVELQQPMTMNVH